MNSSPRLVVTILLACFFAVAFAGRIGRKLRTQSVQLQAAFETGDVR